MSNYTRYPTPGTGSVTNVIATSPLSSTGGATPDISLSGIVPIANGGTGEATAPNAINALLPSQTGNSGKVLSTNGSVASWQTGGGGGANTALSNLASTAVNADILPDTDATRKLGDTAAGKDFLSLAVQNIGSSIGNATSINVRGRNLYDSQGNVAVDWSGNASDPVKLETNGADQKGLAFLDTANTNYVQIQAPATTIATSFSIRLPNVQGSSGDTLQNDGAGNLSWVAGGANLTLSNLGTTNIYADLIPHDNGGPAYNANLGSHSNPWGPNSALSGIGTFEIDFYDSTSGGDYNLYTGSIIGNGSLHSIKSDLEITSAGKQFADNFNGILVGTPDGDGTGQPSQSITVITGNSVGTSADSGGILIKTGTGDASGVDGNITLTAGGGASMQLVGARNGATPSTIQMSSPVGMNSHKITDLTDPTNPQDAATKAYVDSVASPYVPPTTRIKVYNCSGYSSAPSSKIFHFASTEYTLGGSDITYTSDAVNGDYFTTNTAGVYAISLGLYMGASSNVGLSLNISGGDFTTSYQSINHANQLNVAFEGNGNGTQTTIVRYCAAGDKIYPHGGTANAGGINSENFQIVRLS